MSQAFLQSTAQQNYKSAAAGGKNMADWDLSIVLSSLHDRVQDEALLHKSV
jgi:hypothetical protein